MEKLVTKGKYYDSLKVGGKLTYNDKTGTYSCYADGKKVWEKKGDSKLYDYVLSHYDEYGDLIHFLDHDEVMKYEIYQLYSNTVQALCR